MSARSRSKGIRGELELAQFLTERGIPARRGCQRRGGYLSPDVDHGIEGVHLEVKRCESLRLWEAMDQAERDANRERVPVVAHRPNRRPWVAILKLDDFVRLCRDAGLIESEGASC